MASSKVATALVEDVEEEEGTEAVLTAHAKVPLHLLDEEEASHWLTHELPHQTEKIHPVFTRSGTIGTCAAPADMMCHTGTMAEYLKKEGCRWQFVEPTHHRVNAAEQAIQTFKNHFISGICTTNSGGPFNYGIR